MFEIVRTIDLVKRSFVLAKTLIEDERFLDVKFLT